MNVRQYTINRLRDEEGFRGMPYDDHLGKPTIGIGTLLPLTEGEAKLLADVRFNAIQAELHHRLREEAGLNVALVPDTVRAALYDMAYQMGVPRLMGFRRMLAAMALEHWMEAAREALDSRWARQTPARAQRNADLIRKAARLD